MSTRIKSAAVAIVIAVILLIAYGTFLFNIAVGAISALAIYVLFQLQALHGAFRYSNVSALS